MNQTAATVEELTDLAVIVGSTTRRVDPDAIADSDVDAVMTSLAKCKRLIDGATTLMARRVSESGCHKKAGHRSAEEYLAKASGTSKGRAKDQLSTSNKIQDQPETQKAVTEGELSADQAAIVADAVNADPDAAEELLDSARDDSLVGLRKKARNVKFDADPTPDRTRTRHHHRRGFRSWTESDGEWRASLSGPADVGARIEAALRGAHDRIFKAAHASGRREDAACYLFDAMVATLEHGAYRPTAPGSTASSRSRQRGQDHEPHPNPRSEQVASSDPKGDGRADNNAQGGTHPDTGSPTECNDPASRPDDTARQGDSESSDYANGPRDAAGQANTDGPCNASGPGDGDGQTDASGRSDSSDQGHTQVRPMRVVEATPTGKATPMVRPVLRMYRPAVHLTAPLVRNPMIAARHVDKARTSRRTRAAHKVLNPAPAMKAASWTWMMPGSRTSMGSPV